MVLRLMRTSSSMIFGTGWARDAPEDGPEDVEAVGRDLRVEDVLDEGEACTLIEPPSDAETDLVDRGLPAWTCLRGDADEEDPGRDGKLLEATLPFACPFGCFVTDVGKVVHLGDGITPALVRQVVR